jgi:hypothetical protein
VRKPGLCKVNGGGGGISTGPFKKPRVTPTSRV